MKLKKYKDIFEKSVRTPTSMDDYPIDYGDDDDDDIYGRPSYGIGSYGSIGPSGISYGGKGKSKAKVEDEIPSEDMEHLLYLLRTLFKNSGVDADIESKGLDITIFVVLNKKEKMSSIIKVFDVAKKLKKDILPQYDSEFEMWETKTGDPMLTFNFMYEGDDDDENYDGNAPF